MLADHFPEVEDYVLRIGGWQIRNAGTLGGNIANGSPIGDLPPALRARVLSAAFRNVLQWSELVGGDLVVSPPFAWQKLINDSGYKVVNRIDEPVPVLPAPVKDYVNSSSTRSSCPWPTSCGSGKPPRPSARRPPPPRTG